MEIKKGSFLDIALADLDTAEALVGRQNNQAVCASQQAVEKALKAVIEMGGDRAPSIHNVGKLCQLTNNDRLKDRLIEINSFGSLYIDLRYPGSQYYEIDTVSAKKYVALAIEIVDICIQIVTGSEFEQTNLFKD